MSEPIFFLDDHRGVFIPRDFANEVKRDYVTGVSDEQWSLLEKGPDNETYWDVWGEVCDNARLTDPKTKVVYSLWQDGALWLIPEGFDDPDFFGV